MNVLVRNVNIPEFYEVTHITHEYTKYGGYLVFYTILGDVYAIADVDMNSYARIIEIMNQNQCSYADLRHLGSIIDWLEFLEAQPEEDSGDESTCDEWGCMT